MIDTLRPGESFKTLPSYSVYMVSLGVPRGQAFLPQHLGDWNQRKSEASLGYWPVGILSQKQKQNKNQASKQTSIRAVVLNLANAEPL